MTEEHDTVEDVSRDADEEDDGVEIAEEDVVHGGECLIGDDVVGVVPPNKAVTMVFAVTVVNLNLLYCRHCVRNHGDYITSCDILFSFAPRIRSE